MSIYNPWIVYIYQEWITAHLHIPCVLAEQYVHILIYIYIYICTLLLCLNFVDFVAPNCNNIDITHFTKTNVDILTNNIRVICTGNSHVQFQTKTPDFSSAFHCHVALLQGNFSFRAICSDEKSTIHHLIKDTPTANWPVFRRFNEHIDQMHHVISGTWDDFE